MAVPFNPNQVFIYNTSDAFLYLRAGGTDIPVAPVGANLGNADLKIFPQSYYVFTPRNGYLYGALLNNPTQYDCVIFFMEGSAEFVNWTNYTNPGSVIPLPPLPNPNVVASFTFVVSP